MKDKIILVGALNWGLGHATRCIPIINTLQKRGVQLVLASDGAALDLWRTHYPTLPCVALPSYNIRYPSSSMVWNMTRQLPQIIRAIQQEQKRVIALVQEYEIDAIISDNRYGLRQAGIPNIFISHQLHLSLPKWLGSRLVNTLHQRYIGAFDTCWVPDEAGGQNLAGNLAHPIIAKGRYIGVLSRFSPIEPSDKIWDVLAVLSGPEPQRQYLEDALKEQLKTLPYKSLIIRGKPSKQHRQQIGERVYQQDFMPQAALQAAFGQCKFVVARSGYSTLMDLAALQISRALLIPTPGQTEQEYLAQRLAQQERCIHQSQKKLDLEQGLISLSQLNPSPLIFPSSTALEEAIDDLLDEL